MRPNTHKKLSAFGIALGMLAAAGLLAASLYFYDFAFVPAKKSFLNNRPASRLRLAQTWLKKVPKETWHEKAAGADLNLVAVYVPAARPTNKSVVIAHGYMGRKEDMADRIQMFHDAGYNVLAPDDRGHGQSQGSYVGYGWPDRLDYLKWLQKLITRTGSASRIALYGESMGGATVMYLAGEKSLPKQVKAVVEDCGYTSIVDELSYQAKAMYHLPKWPLVESVAALASVKTGYNVFAASSIAAMHQNTRPIFFIHGSKDKFVPTYMVKQVYHATSAPKKLWIVKGAGHAQSFGQNPKEYARRVLEFIGAHL